MRHYTKCPHCDEDVYDEILEAIEGKKIRTNDAMSLKIHCPECGYPTRWFVELLLTDNSDPNSTCPDQVVSWEVTFLNHDPIRVLSSRFYSVARVAEHNARLWDTEVVGIQRVARH